MELSEVNRMSYDSGVIDRALGAEKSDNPYMKGSFKYNSWETGFNDAPDIFTKEGDSEPDYSQISKLSNISNEDIDEMMMSVWEE